MNQQFVALERVCDEVSELRPSQTYGMVDAISVKILYCVVELRLM